MKEETHTGIISKSKYKRQNHDNMAKVCHSKQSKPNVINALSKTERKKCKDS